MVDIDFVGMDNNLVFYYKCFVFLFILLSYACYKLTFCYAAVLVIPVSIDITHKLNLSCSCRSSNVMQTVVKNDKYIIIKCVYDITVFFKAHLWLSLKIIINLAEKTQLKKHVTFI